MMKKHIKSVHQTRSLQYSSCKVQKAFSNNKTPYKDINNRYFGVKLEPIQNSENAAIAEYSTTELVEILERLDSSRRLTGSQSNITAMQSSSNVSAYYDKPDGTLKMDHILSNRVTTDLMILNTRQFMHNFHSLQHDSTKQKYQKYFAMFILFCVRVEIKKNQEPAKTFLSTPDVNTRTILESFVLKLEAVQAEMHASSDNPGQSFC
ncbi:hypothetical protein HDU92_000772 [Lobulomyces angularis]|nr:hypothetical protein HDU92_000772 [Lobulomyces angularis]